MPTTFRIITTGYPTAESTANRAVEHLTQMLKNEKQARMLLSGTRRAIKSNLSESVAMKYFHAFSSAGLLVKIEPEPNAPTVNTAGHESQGAPPSLDSDPKQMLARLKMAVQQADKQLDKDFGTWLGILISITIVAGVSALLMKQMAWYWALGVGLAAASVPMYYTGSRMEKNETDALTRFFGSLTSGTEPDPEWIAFIQACLRQNEIRFKSPFANTLPKQIAAWCNRHNSSDASAMIPGFEAFLGGTDSKRKTQTMENSEVTPEAKPAETETRYPERPPVQAVVNQPSEQSCEKARAVAESRQPAPAPVTEKTTPPATCSGGKHSPKRQPRQRSPKEKAVADSGAGLLGNLIGFLCGGFTFSLARVLIIPLTGSEMVANVVASLFGLVAWRKAANAIRR